MMGTALPVDGDGAGDVGGVEIELPQCCVERELVGLDAFLHFENIYKSSYLSLYTKRSSLNHWVAWIRLVEVSWQSPAEVSSYPSSHMAHETISFSSEVSWDVQLLHCGTKWLQGWHCPSSRKLS